MTILTTSDRPAIKSFCEFIIEQNNGRAEADEQTLYDVAYLLFYERGAIKHENERVLKGNSVLNKRLAELEKQNALRQLKSYQDKIESLLADKMILKDKLNELQQELIKLKSKQSQEVSNEQKRL